MLNYQKVKENMKPATETGFTLFLGQSQSWVRRASCPVNFSKAASIDSIAPRHHLKDHFTRMILLNDTSAEWGCVEIGFQAF